jgi:hypothetical protein
MVLRIVGLPGFEDRIDHFEQLSLYGDYCFHGDAVFGNQPGKNCLKVFISAFGGQRWHMHGFTNEPVSFF